MAVISDENSSIHHEVPIAGNHTYEVETWKVVGYLNDLFNKFLVDMGRAQAREKKEKEQAAKAVQ